MKHPKVPISAEISYLTFAELPSTQDIRIFDYIAIDLDRSGRIRGASTWSLQDSRPWDFLEVPSPPAVIPTKIQNKRSDELLANFETGKYNLYDTAEADLKRLRDFVTLAVQIVRTLA